ncbi:carboxy-S-adenosyl-L-methionine synthase CmoA [methane-oxidizing endosymbiont of Gigantopelta aegis]|uniref:carboxy-S-adenosyl-L-methionine synthase CmoA n=1 Tax=methane-oxidizing endosymbiont of Gigantopelta aegis TaxID=2794938 RepID=UPI0018DDA50D|nr:carboxy-S-adenosyl-L-methionine synthase CmoA [methane-oxidizing endosymbiont of Gigantopelta aegis]
MSDRKDSLYATPLRKIEAFKFDQAVVSVFPDMIQRSVPGYSTIISAIGLLAERFAQPGSRCYDLGCSLGAATLSMRHRISAPDCKIIAVDNSDAMIEGLQQNLAQDSATVPVELHCQDIRDIEIKSASVVVLNFTLQFIPVADRAAFLHKIYQGMLPGGILILSEKLKYADPRQHALQTDMHHLFKKAQGYSDLEISQKRSALENVLIAETFSSHQQRLLNAGFSSVEVWFQYFNFASMLALK